MGSELLEYPTDPEQLALAASSSWSKTCSPHWAGVVAYKAAAGHLSEEVAELLSA